MKAKRFLSLLLSLTLALSLTTPALATEWEGTDYDTAGETALLQAQVDQYAAAHPGELEALSTEQLLQWQGYTETLTPAQQFMEDWELDSEDGIRLNLLWDYVYDRGEVEECHQWSLTYQETYPDRWAEFDADAFFLEECYGSDGNKEAYMRLYHLFTEEEFKEKMFVYYVDEYSWDWENGSDYDAPSFSWPRRDTLTLVVNGQTSDAAVTTQDWVTYTDGAALNPILGTHYPAGEPVSIREAATAAGWDVVWNQRGNEVVLLDRERLRSGDIYPQDLDIPAPDFSTLDGLMNRLLADAAYDSGKTYQLTQTHQLTFTALNSLDGDKTVKADLKLQATMNGSALECEYTLSCAQLLDLLSPQTRAQLEGSLPKFKLKDLKSLLSGGKLTLRADLETGDVYLNAPILALFDDSFSGDTWVHTRADFSQVLTLLDMAQGAGWDTKALLYDLLLAESADSWWAGSAYNSFVESCGLLSALTGPHFLTEKNGGYTWTLNGDSLALLGAAVGGYTGREGYDLNTYFKEFSFTLRVDRNARLTMDMAIRPDMDALGALLADESSYYGETDPARTALMTWLMNLLDFKATAHAAGTNDDLTEETTFHWKNQFKAAVDSQTTRRTTNAAPNALPPEGANIVEY